MGAFRAPGSLLPLAVRYTWHGGMPTMGTGTPAGCATGTLIACGRPGRGPSGTCSARARTSPAPTTSLGFLIMGSRAVHAGGVSRTDTRYCANLVTSRPIMFTVLIMQSWAPWPGAGPVTRVWKAGPHGPCYPTTVSRRAFTSSPGTSDSVLRSYPQPTGRPADLERARFAGSGRPERSTCSAGVPRWLSPGTSCARSRHQAWCSRLCHRDGGMIRYVASSIR